MGDWKHWRSRVLQGKRVRKITENRVAQVIYDERLYEELIRQLESEHEKISPIDRAMLISDAFDFVRVRRMRDSEESKQRVHRLDSLISAHTWI